MDMDYSKYDFKDSTELYVHLSKKGLSKDVVRSISKLKDEPQWMLDFRLRAYDIFMKKPMPTWGADLSTIDFQNIFYYAKATEKTEKSSGCSFSAVSVSVNNTPCFVNPHEDCDIQPLIHTELQLRLGIFSQLLVCQACQRYF